MKITVTTLTGDIFTLDVSPDLNLENIKTLCHSELGLPTDHFMIGYHGNILTDNTKTLQDYDVCDEDVIVILPNREQLGALSSSTNNVPSTSNQTNTDWINNVVSENPEFISILIKNNEKIAKAFVSGNQEEFEKLLYKQLVNAKGIQQTGSSGTPGSVLDNNTFDVNTQKLIAETIRQKNVEANMEAAMEYNPETFGSVVMLYINCKVNGIPVKAFVDSGAQTTIMSSKCAEICNIMRLIDTRWAGLAKGVGIQTIIGRIHMVQVAIENDFLTTSFSILEEQPMDMLLGLDMLKRHQCSIDLKRNVLRIGTTGTETPFLPESELPECAKFISDIDIREENDS